MGFYKGKTVLVTGGTGFVGSHLVEALIGQGANVVATFQELDPHSYFFSLGLDKRVVIQNVDICDFDKVFDVVTKSSVEYIFHLGAQAIVDVAYANPRRTFESNVLGTVNIMESARLFPKVKGVIVASSDKAYGKLEKGKYKETDPLRGDHPYEASKSATDLVSNSYFKTYGVPAVTTRFGNIYGEGDLNMSRIIPGAVEAIIKNQLLTIRSNGKFIRDYLYVKDVVDGYLLIGRNIDKIKGESFNFGSEETLSVLQVLAMIDKTLNTKIKYKIQNTAKNEIPYQSLDYSKIKKRLGWSPRSTLSSTLPKIKDWYSRVII